jgi:hypothetical protein
MGLIRKIFWGVVTLVFTFLFTVLFENGPIDYMKSVEKDIKSLKELVKPVERKKDQSDKLPPR